MRDTPSALQELAASSPRLSRVGTSHGGTHQTSAYSAKLRAQVDVGHPQRILLEDVLAPVVVYGLVSIGEMLASLDATDMKSCKLCLACSIVHPFAFGHVSQGPGAGSVEGMDRVRCRRLIGRAASSGPATSLLLDRPWWRWRLLRLGRHTQIKSMSKRFGNTFRGLSIGGKRTLLSVNTTEPS